MSKTKIAIAVIIVILLAISGWFFLTKDKPSDQLVNPLTQDTVSVPDSSSKTTETEELQLTSYSDPSGFTISLPENLSVDTVEDFDKKTDYAKVVVSGTDGEMKIWMTEIDQTSLDEWLGKNPNAPKQLSLIGASSLGGISAKQYKTANKVYTLAFDQGIIYYISAPNDDYWQKVHETVITSFKFAGEETKTSVSGTSSSGGSENIIYEEEEVIE